MIAIKITPTKKQKVKRESSLNKWNRNHVLEENDEAKKTHVYNNCFILWLRAIEKATELNVLIQIINKMREKIF